MKNNKHKFAIFLEKNFFYDESEKIFILNDFIAVKRINSVLRLKEEEEIVFFDLNYNFSCKIKEILKTKIIFNLNDIQENRKEKKNNIVFFLPLLKKESLENSIYFLTEIGVEKIYLLTTEKSNFKNFNDNYFERLKKIIISSAEQSKNFYFPEIFKPMKIEKFFQNYDFKDFEKISFDFNGKSIISNILKFDKQNIALVIGPEGDFTEEEKLVLEKLEFKSYCLTNTILKSSEAIIIGAGIFLLK